MFLFSQLAKYTSKKKSGTHIYTEDRTKTEESKAPQANIF